MIGELEQADLAERIRDYVRERKGQFIPIGEISKHFERKIDDVRKLNEVIWHVESTGDIVQVPKDVVQSQKMEWRGRPTTYFTWNEKRK
jgi:hypothetical protein